MMLLPIVLRLFAKFEGIPQKTGVELSLMTRFFIFQVVVSMLLDNNFTASQVPVAFVPYRDLVFWHYGLNYEHFEQSDVGCIVARIKFAFGFYFLFDVSNGFLVHFLFLTINCADISSFKAFRVRLLGSCKLSHSWCTM